MWFANVTLIVFVACVALSVVALLVDLCLYAIDWPTITECVWQRPWLGVPLVGVQLVSAVSLALHLWLKVHDAAWK